MPQAVPDPPVDWTSLRELVARFMLDPGWLPAAAESITEAIHAEIPLDNDQHLRASTYASTESVLWLMVAMILRDQPPQEAEPTHAAIANAREFVRRGLPIAALLRAYPIGQATFFRGWVAQLNSQLDDPRLIARGIELGAAWTFTYIRTLSGALVELYAQEREQWVRSASALRRETVSALLAGTKIDAHTAGQRLGYELDRHHLAFVVWPEDGANGVDVAALEHAAVQYGNLIGATGVLVVALNPGLVAAWIGAWSPIAVDSDGQRSQTQTPVTLLAGGTLLAVGNSAAGTDGFRRSHDEAMQARQVTQLLTKRPRTPIKYDDVALAALGSIDVRRAREFVERELGLLARQDDDTRRLAITLQAYLEEQASPRRTAQRLGVHENTVKNRVRAAEDILGRASDRRVAELLLALRLAELTL
jgi:sugar diacid utilization regulator